MKKWLLLINTTILFASCHKTEKQDDFITTIKETGKLITAEYTLSKIIKANDNKTWYKVGDRKILMSCEAYLKAGVDLQQVSTKNVEQNDSTITIKLPPAQIFSLNIPANKIQVQYQDIGMLRDAFSAAEREALLAQAQYQIKQLADSLGILKTAELNATIFLQNMLQSASSKKIIILYTQ
jgi:hypothetical protein